MGLRSTALCSTHSTAERAERPSQALSAEPSVTLRPSPFHRDEGCRTRRCRDDRDRERVPDDVSELRSGAKQRSLHAVLVESLTNTKALLTRLEAGVQCAALERGCARALCADAPSVESVVRDAGVARAGVKTPVVGIPGR